MVLQILKPIFRHVLDFGFDPPGHLEPLFGFSSSSTLKGACSIAGISRANGCRLGFLAAPSNTDPHFDTFRLEVPQLECGESARTPFKCPCQCFARCSSSALASEYSAAFGTSMKPCPCSLQKNYAGPYFIHLDLERLARFDCQLRPSLPSLMSACRPASFCFEPCHFGGYHSQ